MAPSKSIAALTPFFGWALLAAADAPVVMTTFTHMEGSYQYPTLSAFNLHANKLRTTMSLFEEYQARMTIESEKSFANACINYQDNVMAEAISRGHGVGTHCDFGLNEPATTPEQYAQFFLANRAPVDALVGAINNRHCSGGCGESDWVLAAVLAGFDFRSEAVGVCYLSMPMDARPAGWTNQYIRSTAFHEESPVDLADRLKPRHLANALNFAADAGADYVLTAGGLGRIDAFEEVANGQTVGPNPAFTQNDVDLFFADLDEALAVRDTTHFAKLLVHFPIASMDSTDEPRIRQILSRLRNDYVLTGKLIWATQGEAYDAFLRWESGIPGDIDMNGSVNGVDLAQLLANWGSAVIVTDIDFNGTTNGADLALLLANWTP